MPASRQLVAVQGWAVERPVELEDSRTVPILRETAAVARRKLVAADRNELARGHVEENDLGRGELV